MKVLRSNPKMGWMVLEKTNHIPSPLPTSALVELGYNYGIGMAMGRSGVEGWGLRPHPAGFCLTQSPAPCLRRKTFSPHSHPLGPHKAPPYLVKLYFFLTCPTTSTILLMKPMSLIKIYLKLKLNSSHQIKSIFRKKKMNNIFKCLTRQS